MKNGRGGRVALIVGCRIPFARASTEYRDFDAVDLGKLAASELLHRAELPGEEVDAVIFGIALPPVKRPNVAREVSLAIGIPASAPAHTVVRACASSNTAITDAAEKILLGQARCVLAGGAESISDVPVLLSRRFRSMLLMARMARGLRERLSAFRGLRFRDFLPEVPAIAEPSTGLTMGESAEKMAKENAISREAQDALALRSHQNAAAAAERGIFAPEVAPVLLPPRYARAVTRDNLVRPGTTAEKLAALRPVFDRRYGSVTAGNSSALTDGAAAVVLMSEEKARAAGRPVLAWIRSWAYAALPPSDQLLMGPAYAIPIALRRAGLSLAEMHRIEMHEAFAAQVLSNIQALESDRFAREKLGFDRAVGQVDPAKLNVHGGSIALGHPFGATGARLTTTLAHELRRSGGQFGLLSVCAAGAMGVAMVLERGD
jgi:acetyl-CoA acyltransferase